MWGIHSGLGYVFCFCTGQYHYNHKHFPGIQWNLFDTTMVLNQQTYILPWIYCCLVSWVYVSTHSCKSNHSAIPTWSGILILDKIQYHWSSLCPQTRAITYQVTSGLVSILIHKACHTTKQLYTLVFLCDTTEGWGGQALGSWEGGKQAGRERKPEREKGRQGEAGRSPLLTPTPWKQTFCKKRVPFISTI